MLPPAEPGRAAPSLSTRAAAVLGSCMVGSLLVWRLELIHWATWYRGCQTVTLMLGFWLLSGGHAAHGSARRWIGTLGTMFTMLWILGRLRIALLTETPPAEYAAVLGQTHMHFWLYVLEGLFMQTVLHQSLPGWACMLLGCVQALLQAASTCRYMAPDTVATVVILRTVLIAQAAMLLPYQLVCCGFWRKKQQPASNSEVAAVAVVKSDVVQPVCSKAAADLQPVDVSKAGTSKAASISKEGLPQRCPAVATAPRTVVPPVAVMPRLSSIILGLLGCIIASVLCAWRMGLRPWDVVQGSCQFSLFVLGCWLLPRDTDRANPNPSIKALGITFTCLRMMAYIRTAIELPVEYYPVFQITWTYALFGVYVAESTLLQALWHRLLPAWACAVIGAVQASVMTIMSFRLTAGAMPWWRIMHIVVTPQIGMFVPYHLWAHPHVQKLLGRGSTASTVASSGLPLPNIPLPAASLEKQHNEKELQSADMYAADEVETKPSTTTAAGLLTTAIESQTPAISKLAAAGLKGKTSSTTGVSASMTDMHAAIRKLSTTSYKSQLRVMRTVCVKLDTDIPYTALPADLAANLQGALRASIGHATSLSITDVAVRPGCICITMKVEQDLDTIPEGATDSASAQLQPDVLAQTLLPELQNMLSRGPTQAAVFQRSMVQVDQNVVSCVWSETRQAWEVHMRQMLEADTAVDSPWLGIAQASGTRSVTGIASGSTAPAFQSVGLLEVLAEVQLWGVSKVADVEGWTPPQQHQDSELQWPGAQQPSGSSPALKLLARAAGGYLPTQVVRLVPGSTDGYVTAQVLVQLHEHQLVTHHEGGAPSTLLLMDLELWQNEVLLSSSPLLSLPGNNAPNSKPPAVAWWWGASDKVVGAAMQELEECRRQCTQASEEDDMQTAIQACVQYQQDLATWLLQVQRVAGTTATCMCAQTGRGNAALALLQQPCLTPAPLLELGRDLKQYAAAMGWRSVEQMVSQQMRSVVRPAASSQARSSSSGSGSSSRWLLSSLRTSLLGYPCHHDEALYKQKLAAHLRGLLLVSSTATSLIGIVWGFRSLQWDGIQLFACLNWSWLGLHLVVLATMLLNNTRKQQVGIQRAYACIAMTYLWRVIAHPIVMHLTTAEATNTFMQAFPQPQLWAACQLVLVLTEQVPASVLLPAPWLFLVGLLIDFPAHIVPVMRGTGWGPVMSAMVAFPVVVGARLVLDAHLRKHLSTPPRRTASSAMERTRSKVD